MLMFKGQCPSPTHLQFTFLHGMSHIHTYVPWKFRKDPKAELEPSLLYTIWEPLSLVWISFNIQVLIQNFISKEKIPILPSPSHWVCLNKPPQGCPVFFSLFFFSLPYSASNSDSFRRILIGTLTPFLLQGIFLHMCCIPLCSSAGELYQYNRHSLCSVFTQTVSECLVSECRLFLF